MKKYNWRRNFQATSSHEDSLIKGYLAFKTTATHWIGTHSPVVITISTHSAFHQGIMGSFKMQAFTSIIKKEVRGKITILLADIAHLHARQCQYSLKETFDTCIEEAKALAYRFKEYFEGCEVKFWHSYINEDLCYLKCSDEIKHLYQDDPIFKAYLYEDAMSTYTLGRALENPDKALFIEKTTQDLLEQCIALLVLIHKGYRFHFYPGQQFKSTNYVNQLLLNTMSFIDVFLTIEKKTIVKNVNFK